MNQRIISVPMAISLGAVGIVWVGGAVFNFTEQMRFAENSGFELAFLLPLLLDGLAIALASVATSASMDGRAAIVPRLGTLVAVGASSWVSGQAAYARAFVRVDAMSLETRFDSTRVIIGVGVPLFSLLAFEVLLVEIRRVVQKVRGRVSPVPIPMPRLVMWIAQPPWRTYSMWRRAALEQCTRELTIVQAQAVQATVTQVSTATPAPAAPSTPARREIVQRPERVITPTSDADRIAQLAGLLRTHGTDIGVTRFRELARNAGYRCPNGDARTLLEEARRALIEGSSS